MEADPAEEMAVLWEKGFVEGWSALMEVRLVLDGHLSAAAEVREQDLVMQMWYRYSAG